MHLLIVLLLLLFVPKTAQALYNGNPALLLVPEEGIYFAKEAWLALRAGYEGDLIFNRKMDRHVHQFRVLENFGIGTVGFFERFEVYGGLGSFTAKMHQQTSQRRLELETRNQLAWKVGSRLLAWKSEETFLTLHIGYQHAAPSLNEITVNGTPFGGKKGKLFYNEIAGGAGIGHKIDLFIPYIGAQASYANAKLQKAPGNNFRSFHSRSPIGLFLGCGLSPGAKVIVNVEVRMIDEQAITLSGDIRF